MMGARRRIALHRTPRGRETGLLCRALALPRRGRGGLDTIPEG